ncbi:MAG: PAS domain S-box protein [Gallionella sp.]|nr:PAS domain S-box protein [Gallionella sp.]
MSNKNPGEAERRSSADLRAAVEDRLAHSPPDTTVLPIRSAEELLHMLQVHQIELEMQNENLRQAQFALEESRDRYRDLYDFAPVAYLTLNDQGMISEINLTGAGLFAVEHRKLIKRNFAQFIVADARECWRRCFQDLLNNMGSHAAEVTLRRGDGSTFWAQMECICQKEISGGASVRMVLTDITARKLADEKLQESEGKFRAIFEGTMDGIVLVDDSGMIVDFNSVFVQQSGLSPERLRQTRIWELRPVEQFKIAQARFFSVLETGQGGVADVKYRKPDGSVIDIEFRSTPIRIGNKRYLQSLVRDITLHKAREHELHNYQQLLRDMAANSSSLREAESKRIAREVHDELGQLLTALRIDISLLRIEFGERDPLLKTRIQNMLVLVDKSIQGARHVTANLRPAALDMGIVPAIAWLCDEFSERTNTACTLRVVDEPLGLDDARTVALFRIVQESLTNITRHAQATRVEITVEQSDDDIVLEIHDNGKGFDPAARAENQSFGLMGMRERAIALGGKVIIDSAPSEGTVVSVHIPIFDVCPGRRVDD